MLSIWILRDLTVGRPQAPRTSGSLDLGMPLQTHFTSRELDCPQWSQTRARPGPQSLPMVCVVVHAHAHTCARTHAHMCTRSKEVLPATGQCPATTHTGGHGKLPPPHSWCCPFLLWASETSLQAERIVPEAQDGQLGVGSLSPCGDSNFSPGARAGPEPPGRGQILAPDPVPSPGNTLRL